ncbi:MAG: hypothetical protein ACOX0Z_01535 [Candidatus Nanosyncoccaceae bacterium]|jgi:hypothetical protein
MNKSKVSRIFPIILIILIVTFAIFVLVAVGKKIFKSDGKTSDKQAAVSQASPRDELLTTTTDRAVRATVRGQIVADEDFRSYQITITPSERRMVVFKSYLSEQVESISLDNNVPAYTEFVYALSKAGLGRSKPFPAELDNVSGICASGTLFEFDILRDGESVYHVWTSDCGGSKGSLGVSASNLRDLFLKQIPDNKKLLSTYNKR